MPETKYQLTLTPSEGEKKSMKSEATNCPPTLKSVKVKTPRCCTISDVEAIYITPITPPVYIHQGPFGSATKCSPLKIIKNIKKNIKNIVPITKFKSDVA